MKNESPNEKDQEDEDGGGQIVSFSSLALSK